MKFSRNIVFTGISGLEPELYASEAHMLTSYIISLCRSRCLCGCPVVCSSDHQDILDSNIERVSKYHEVIHRWKVISS